MSELGAALGAALCATLRALDTDTTLSGLNVEAVLLAFSIVNSSGLVTDLANDTLDRAWEGATDAVGSYSIALSVLACDAGIDT